MTVSEVTLILGTILLIMTGLTVWQMYFTLKVKKKNSKLEGRERGLRSHIGVIERDNIRLKQRNKELNNILMTNIEVGSIFYSPTSGNYKKEFIDTTQRVTSVDHERRKFTSTDGSHSWSNSFNQAKDYTWESKPKLTHKFIK